MRRTPYKPPARTSVRSNHNDYGPELMSASRCYFLSYYNLSRKQNIFPAVSLLDSTMIEKVEGMGEYGYGY